MLSRAGVDGALGHCCAFLFLLKWGAVAFAIDVSTKEWSCQSASNSKGGRAHSPMIIFCVILNIFMSVLLVHETQESHSGEGGTVVRRVGFRVKNDVTVWDPERGPARSTSWISQVSGPAGCGHLPGSELKTERRTQESKHVCKFFTILTRLEPTPIRGELWFAF